MQSVVNQDWRGALIRHLLLVLAASLVLGVVSGHYGWALALGLALYLGWTLWQLLRLHQWLRNHQPDEPPPDSYGLWAKSSTISTTCNAATSAPVAACRR